MRPCLLIIAIFWTQLCIAEQAEQAVTLEIVEEDPAIGETTTSLAETTAKELGFDPKEADLSPLRLSSDDTISIDFPDEEVRAILRNVGDIYELNLIVPDTLQARTSIKLRDVTWRQIFDAMLPPSGYSYREVGNIIYVEKISQMEIDFGDADQVWPPFPEDGETMRMGPNDTISFDFPDEEVQTIISNIAYLNDLNVVIPDKLQGRTSIKLSNATWQQAFDIVLTPLGYTYRVNGNIVYVEKPGFTAENYFDLGIMALLMLSLMLNVLLVIVLVFKRQKT